MSERNCSEINYNMSNVEASLRAKLLVKCAEIADIQKKYENLAKAFDKLENDFKKQQDKTKEYLDDINNMTLQLHYYAGKIAAYQAIVESCIDG